uniref:RING-type domain-containing protein n=1 Tax=Oreochromis aureus TaxID=47969 RepID=A0A668VI76_OREAU
MVLCEDGDCSVCLLPYSREERIPRVLHCRHTFCDSCLERMSTERNGLLTVGCPLCRRVTCIGRGRGLREALWVNSKLWDQIPEDVDIREEEEEEEGEKQTEVQSDEATPGENRAWQQIKSKSNQITFTSLQEVQY